MLHIVGMPLSILTASIGGKIADENFKCDFVKYN